MDQLTRTLQAEGRLDSVGTFEVDEEARERKLGIDRRKLEIDEFQKLRDLPAYDEKLKNDEKYGLWRKYQIRIAYKLAWRWGLVVGALVFAYLCIHLQFQTLDNINLFSLSINHLVFDPLAMGLITGLAILAIRLSLVCDKDNSPMVILVAICVFFYPIYKPLTVTQFPVEFTEYLLNCLMFATLPGLVISLIGMFLTSGPGKSATQFASNIHEKFCSWITVKDP